MCGNGGGGAAADVDDNNNGLLLLLLLFLLGRGSLSAIDVKEGKVKADIVPSLASQFGLTIGFTKLCGQRR